MILTKSNSIKRISSTPDRAFRSAFFDEFRWNLPFFVVFCLICLFVLLVPQTLRLISQQQTADTLKTAVENNSYLTENYTANTPRYCFGLNPLSVFLFPVLAFVLAILQCAYLTNRRAVDVFAALPIRRARAMGAKLLAGITMLCVPVVLCYTGLFLLNGAVAGFRLTLFWELCFLLLTSIVFMLVPYAVSMLVAALSGTLTEYILYPVVFLGSPVLILLGVNTILKADVYGYTGMRQLSEVMGYLFPYFTVTGSSWEIIHGLTNAVLNQTGETKTLFMLVTPALWQLFTWLGISVICMVAAVFCFKRRKSELAGKRSASHFLSALTLLLATTIVGVLAWLLPQVFWTEDSLFYQMRYILFFAGTLLAFVVFGLLVHHSVRGMLRNYRDYLIGLPFYILFVCIVSTGGFGAYDRVLTADEIAEARVSVSGLDGTDQYHPVQHLGRGAYTYVDQLGNLGTEDSAVVEKILSFQEKVLEQGKQPGNYGSVELSYRLKNGQTVSRTYDQVSDEAQSMLSFANDDPEFKQSNSYAFTVQLPLYQTVKLCDPYRTRLSAVTAEKLNLSELQRALRKDVLAETIEEIRSTNQPPVGMICLSNVLFPDGSSLEQMPGELNIVVKATYQNTIAYLEERGLMELLQPDYSKITELLVVSSTDGKIESVVQNSNGGYAKWRCGLKDLFYISALDSLSAYQNYKEIYTSENIPNSKVTYVSEPEEIRSILAESYIQHTVYPNSRVVCVLSEASPWESVQLIQPNPSE